MRSYHGSDSLGDAARPGDHEVEFLRAVANWIEIWSNTSDLSLTTAKSKIRIFPNTVCQKVKLRKINPPASAQHGFL